MFPRILRYHDLKDAGIVGNRATLYRWIKDHGFPPGLLLGPNSRGWAEADVLSWLDSRLVGASLYGTNPEIRVGTARIDIKE